MFVSSLLQSDPDSCGRTTQKITSPAARRGCASGHGTAGARPVEAVAGCAPRPRARRSRERRLAAARGCVVANCIAQAEVRCVRGNRAERGPRQTARACGSAGAPAAGAAAVAGHWTPPAKRVPARAPSLAACRLRPAASASAPGWRRHLPWRLSGPHPAPPVSPPEAPAKVPAPRRARPAARHTEEVRQAEAKQPARPLATASPAASSRPPSCPPPPR
eukprot:scaffold111188_cov62-Phaeocystis_antarctica.AAC.7